MTKRLLSLTLLILIVCASFVSCGNGNVKYDVYAMMPNAVYRMEGAAESTESYTEIVENGYVSAAQTPDSYFSIDANTASYPILRGKIRGGAGSKDIPRDAVRVEEMLNYFSYDYPAPEGDEILSLTASVFDCPYEQGTLLLTLGLSTVKVDPGQQQNNLVFLIDTSGSMYGEDRLGLVQDAFRLLTESLGPNDRVSIVTYAGSDTVVLRGVAGSDKQAILTAIEDLEASGSTAGGRGIQSAYDLATQYFIEGGNNRVILMTDGDFNVGVSSEKGLERLISEKRSTGVYFSVFGVGYGNLMSSKMETLALAGNGTYHYLDSRTEARRALVEQIGGTLLTVAKDVKAGITFDPAFVDSYRLVGYENKLLTEEEFADDDTDAGELGAGHTSTVVYQIKPVAGAQFIPEDLLANVVIRYKPTENTGGTSDTSLSLTLPVKWSDYHATPTENDLFVTSVVEFALVLRDSPYKGTASFAGTYQTLQGMDFSNDPLRAEFRELVRILATEQ